MSETTAIRPKIDLRNRWVRMTSDDRTYHLNANAPESPAQGKTVCGIATTTPIYASELRPVENYPCAVAKTCFRCENPHLYMPKTQGDTTQ